MGVLSGLRVIEMAGIGPAPFCCMQLADMGADVLRIDRLEESGLGVPTPPKLDLLNRGKRSLAVDLKSSQGVDTVKALIRQADVLIEGFRPGVMEKLGLGPDACLGINPKLVFGRMTGWGQSGPLSQRAGHDINFIAITGALNAIGRKEQPPSIPLNLIGDFAGGSLYLAMGVLAAVISARHTGVGQVVDAAIVDGVVNLLTMQWSFDQMGIWSTERGCGFINGGAPFYDVYETADGRYMAVGCVEKKFYEEFVVRLGLDITNLPKQNDQSRWDELREQFARMFKSRLQSEWVRIFSESDACVAPVLDMEEAVSHPHNIARNLFTRIDGALNPLPAPKFSKTPSSISRAAPSPGADGEDALSDWGFSPKQITALRDARTIL